ncbi:hypothetical protein [Acidisoma sp. S159]|uniref:hypothetical protein n=1 Tax=Acidisoma sp. S159 TaxID=1747225 RepID=UPI00131B4EDF|nr:hypothetical protein [Acidisoma sp. S159]
MCPSTEGIRSALCRPGAWTGNLDRIALSFAPIAVVGGTISTGQFLRMRQELATQGPDHDTNEQYFTMADGTGTEWLNHRYDYVRRV